MPDSVKNIIFDFGGVIFNIDHKRVENAFRNLGLENFDMLFNQALQTDVFRKFETGSITPGEFRQTLRDITGLTVPDAILDAAWNQILVNYPPHRIELLKQIRSNYRLFLLSNTNSIHFDHYIALFFEEFGYDFTSLFEETFWSFKIGKRKPDPDPYLHILDKHRLNPAETLFIDDTIQNIEAASSLGIKAFHLNNGMDLGELFSGSGRISEIVTRS
jgi:putative hydrolase of the HAD superfamily